jgi:HSP20 family molecular chaperone IbpA
MKTVENGQRPATAPQNRPTEYVTPEVNIFETKDGYVVEAEMPGVNKEGLEIMVEGNELTIVGHRNSDQVNGQPLYRERRLVDYRRSFELDPAIDTGKTSAKIDQGIVTVTLPKSEKVKPRKIAID